MSHLTKTIFIFSLLILVSIYTGFAQEVHKLYQTEYIQQKVKSIIETIHSKNGLLKVNKRIIPEFDNRNVFQHCIVTQDTTADSWDRSIKYFDNKYVKPRKDQDTTGFYYVDNFSVTADKIGSECRLRNHNLFLRNVFKFGPNNADNNLTEFDIYDSNDNLVFKQGYIFNQRNRLIEVDNYSNNNVLTDKATFKYVLFDKKGNWIKRIEKKEDTLGKITRVVVTDRKITYY
jgi:hypothetical protein